MSPSEIAQICCFIVFLVENFWKSLSSFLVLLIQGYFACFVPKTLQSTQVLSPIWKVIRDTLFYTCLYISKYDIFEKYLCEKVQTTA